MCPTFKGLASYVSAVCQFVGQLFTTMGDKLVAVHSRTESHLGSMLNLQAGIPDVLPGSFEGGSCTVPTGLLPIGRSSAERKKNTKQTDLRQVYVLFKKQKAKAELFQQLHGNTSWRIDYRLHHDKTG